MGKCNDCEHVSCKYSACINGSGFVPKAKPYKDDHICPNCSTYNEVWTKRENTVKKDIVYCWHCGCKVQLK